MVRNVNYKQDTASSECFGNRPDTREPRGQIAVSNTPVRAKLSQEAAFETTVNTGSGVKFCLTGSPALNEGVDKGFGHKTYAVRKRLDRQGRPDKPRTKNKRPYTIRKRQVRKCKTFRTLGDYGHDIYRLGK